MIELLESMQRLKQPICMVTRLLHAALYEPAPERKPRQKGRPRKKGVRLPTLEQVLQDEKTVWQPVMIEDWYGEGRRDVEVVSGAAVWFDNGRPPLPIRWVLPRDPKGKFKAEALLCTDQEAKPVQILQWFVMRWQEEVTFREVRTHLGVEMQQQWSDLAIARATPALLGLFSVVILLADQSVTRCKLPIRQAAWYSKQLPTFSDALAVVRKRLWQAMTSHAPPSDANIARVPRTLPKRFTEALCYAA